MNNAKFVRKEEKNKMKRAKDEQKYREMWVGVCVWGGSREL